MRLKSYNGSIKNVGEVIAAVEERYVFNGVKKRSLEKCRNSSVKPNALVFVFNKERPGEMNFGMGMESDLLIGNLPSGVACKILDSMLTKGYADISNMEFQKVEFNERLCKFDGGKSAAPYRQEGFNLFTNVPGMLNENVFSPAVGEDVGFEDMDDESLRKRIYDESSYTMAELGAMGRDELERVHDEIFGDLLN